MFVSLAPRHAGLLLALTLTAAGAAPGDNPADFRQVVPLAVSGRQGVVRLQLPRAVYLGARSADLRDLRVFDAAGASMPYALIDPDVRERTVTSTVAAAVFAVRASAANSQPIENLQIRTRDDGAVISVSAPSAQAAGDVLSSLILDMQPANGAAPAGDPISALTLALPDGVRNYSARVALDTSDDLQHWDERAQAALNWLENASGKTVRTDRIEFAPRPFRYARLRWLEGKPVEFKQVLADYQKPVGPARVRDEIVLQPAQGEAGKDLVYPAPLALPVESVGLLFQTENVVLPALVGRYVAVPDRGPVRDGYRDLEPLAAATFYRLTQNGRPRVSGDIDVPVAHLREWVVRPQARVQERPALRLRWSPATIVFTAGGKPPYRLAFGLDGVSASQVPLDQVAPGFSRSELAALEQARAGDAIQQHAAGGGTDDGTHALRARTAWLWGLLVCGVAALGWMAWRLAHQIKSEDTETPT